MFTGTVAVRNGPIGIASFDVLPRALADAHVDRHLTALEPGAHLVRARARLLALDPAAGVAALAGAGPASDALAVLALLCRLDVREAQLLRHVRASRPSRGGSPSAACLRARGSRRARRLRPILPRPSARSVPRWRSLWPIWDFTCVMLHLRHLRVVLLLPERAALRLFRRHGSGRGRGLGRRLGLGARAPQQEPAPPPQRAPPTAARLLQDDGDDRGTASCSGSAIVWRRHGLERQHLADLLAADPRDVLRAGGAPSARRSSPSPC